MLISPAAYVIDLFGGIRPLARELDVEPSTVWRWKEPAAVGGSDGQIPRTVQGRLLDLARARGLDLTAEDLIRGREELVLATGVRFSHRVLTSTH